MEANSLPFLLTLDWSSDQNLSAKYLKNLKYSSLIKSVKENFNHYDSYVQELIDHAKILFEIAPLIFTLESSLETTDESIKLFRSFSSKENNSPSLQRTTSDQPHSISLPTSSIKYPSWCKLSSCQLEQHKVVKSIFTFLNINVISNGSCIRGILTLQQRRASNRLKGLSLFQALLSSSDNIYLQKEIIWVLNLFLNNHYLDGIYACGSRLTQLSTTAFHAVYFEIAKYLSKNINLHNCDLDTLINSWNLLWKPSDHSFLRDSKIFSIIGKFMHIDFERSTKLELKNDSFDSYMFYPQEITSIIKLSASSGIPYLNNFTFN